ncbi:NIL domain-containing protein [Leptolyngbya sp. NIES-2104]|uniref:NIL domain-containing protein n=1 Tax=Leptolyngbya sp. NIES-2104 TaxID=1552121 RepID=UPI0006EC5BD1|nr:NIL domain-containing protein [Leptolyngbya sp. NIES-2104]GAP94161.1 ferredoxin [Leptolyngbya sp. NIES-2104]
MTPLRYQPLNRVRLRLEIPASYYQEPILSRLVSQFKLVVNIIEAQLSRENTIDSYCDIELRGTPQQINQGLNYLKSLNVQIVGKPNTVEEDWY